MKMNRKNICFGIGLVMILIGILNTGTEFLFYNSLIFPIAGVFLMMGCVKPVLKMIGFVMMVLVVLLIGRELFQSGFYFGLFSFSIFMTLTYAALMGVGAAIYRCVKCLFNHAIGWKRRSFFGVIGVFLLLWILAGANSLLGNPITASKATRSIERYVMEQYPDEDLIVKDASYSFKNGDYESEVYNEENDDVYFYVRYQNNQIVEDSYERTVLSYFNTLKRLSAQYSIVINNLLNEKMPLKHNTSYVNYDFEAVDYMSEVLALGMEFDETLPISAQVTLRFELENETLSDLSDRIVEAFQLFEESGYYFDVYHLVAENEKRHVMIEGITPKDIESGQLSERIEAGLANVSAFGIKTITTLNE